MYDIMVEHRSSNNNTVHIDNRKSSKPRDLVFFDDESILFVVGQCNASYVQFPSSACVIRSRLNLNIIMVRKRVTLLSSYVLKNMDLENRMY